MKSSASSTSLKEDDDDDRSWGDLMMSNCAWVSQATQMKSYANYVTQWQHKKSINFISDFVLFVPSLDRESTRPRSLLSHYYCEFHYLHSYTRRVVLLSNIWRRRKKIVREKRKNGKIRYEPSPSMAINYIESLKELSRSRASSFFTMYTQQQQPSIPIHLTLSTIHFKHSRKSNKRWKSIRRKIRWRKIPGTSIEILNFSMKYLNKFHKYLKDHS